VEQNYDTLPGNIAAILFLLAIGLFPLWIVWDIVVRLRRKKFIKNYRFPSIIEQKLISEYPQLVDSDIPTIFHALEQYNLCCVQANKWDTTSPSKIVDFAWQQFRENNEEYDLYCRRAFGRVLPDEPFHKIVSQDDISEELTRTWANTCEITNINRSKPRDLPILFSIDHALNIPNGNHFYLIVEGKSKSLFVNNDINLTRLFHDELPEMCG